MDDASPARPVRSVFLAFLAGILPAIYVWTLLSGPYDEAQQDFGLVLVAYFVLGGFVGYLGRAPVWASASALVVPATGLLLLRAATVADPRALPILVAILLLTFATAYGGKRFGRAKATPDDEDDLAAAQADGADRWDGDGPDRVDRMDPEGHRRS